MRYEMKKALMNISRVAVFFGIWISFNIAFQGSLYFDALGFFIAIMIVLSDKIYRFFGKWRRGY